VEGWKVKDVHAAQRLEGGSTSTIELDTESKFYSEAEKMVDLNKNRPKEDPAGFFLIVIVSIDTVLDSNNSGSLSALPQAEKKTLWTMEEDDTLCLLAASHILRSKENCNFGLSGWGQISDMLKEKNFGPPRTPIACKSRWIKINNRHLHIDGILDMCADGGAEGST
jgi:hypothetical protein